MTLDNANQLVKGNQVKVGGVPVGSVSKIELADDGRARIELTINDDGLKPLHQRHARDRPLDVAVRHRQPLRRAAARPDDEPEIADGGSIPAEGVHGEVDLDEVLNTLDPDVQKDLRIGGRASSAARSTREAGQGPERGHPRAEPGAVPGRADRAGGAARPGAVRALPHPVGRRGVRRRHARRPHPAARGQHARDARRGRRAGPRTSSRRCGSCRRRCARPTPRWSTCAARSATCARPCGWPSRSRRSLTDFLVDLQPTARLARPVVGDLRATIDSPGRERPDRRAARPRAGRATRACPRSGRRCRRSRTCCRSCASCGRTRPTWSAAC